MKEIEFMHEAIRISFETMRSGNGGPFGAIVVKEGKIIGRGGNSVLATNDPTAHAEIVAIREACAALGNFQLDGCEIYTSCEPCPMCLGAIYWARPARVFYANTKTDAAVAGFDDAMIYSELRLENSQRKFPMTQICRQEAFAAFQEWQNKTDKIAY